jgi:uncharacterized peroxidase-related enzyme
VAHIDLQNEAPGLLGLMAYSPETAKPLNELVDILLRGDGTLTPAEREMIATHVSAGNDCLFCHSSHGAAAACHLDGDEEAIARLKADADSAPVSDKMRALLAIAGKVRVSGKEVTAEDVQAARDAGATDREVHDTVLIAATLCMFNRYVDGLGTESSGDEKTYRAIGMLLATRGYTAAFERFQKRSRHRRPDELSAVPTTTP